MVFDGGSLGNPGRGSGSFQIVDAGGVIVAEERLEYGDNITNNGAEFRTLVAALERLLACGGEAARAGKVAVRGDSQLVINGVTGAWKIKHEDLKPLKERAVRLLGEFAAVDVRWQRRDLSVRVLGH
ncbi:MAG: reverse transcriptase-like protein [Thermomicrobiales bacterium]|nr:reverse transcriptase-like protein [Thermomicrobiales bacterium]